MSSGTIVEKSSEIASPSRSFAPSRSDPSLRVWPAVVAVLIFWAFLFATRLFEMSMFARFMSRLGAYAVLLLFSLGWWLSRRSVSWRDRLLAMAVSGNLRGVAVATVEAGGFVGMEWVGEPADRHLLAVGVADLQYAIFASRYERSTVADQPDAGDEPA